MTIISLKSNKLGPRKGQCMEKVSMQIAAFSALLLPPLSLGQALSDVSKVFTFFILLLFICCIGSSSSLLFGGSVLGNLNR